ncbi:MAG: HAMP domain-containing histidine kinase [Anaerolineae bacterium]|nr:HAMP domain-containing histidine kinase [Anaerolineae bacterium]
MLARIRTHLTLSQQQRELDQQRQLMARFLSMASHEFSTPLAVIRSVLDILRHHRERLLPEKISDLLESAEGEVSRLNELVEMILFINRAEQGKIAFNPRPMALQALADRLQARIQEVFVGRAFDFALLCPLERVVLDAYLIEHVVLNLVSNAFKYTPPDGAVRLRIEDRGERLYFIVQDEGLGVPPQEIPRLTEAFYRASNSGQASGTGLGLTVVADFLGRHGGGLEIESRLGQGSTFSAWVPLIPGEGD